MDCLLSGLLGRWLLQTEHYIELFYNRSMNRSLSGTPRELVLSNRAVYALSISEISTRKAKSAHITYYDPYDHKFSSVSLYLLPLLR